MLRMILSCSVAVLCAACAGPSTKSAVPANAAARQARACDEPVTGSHMRRCARDDGSVDVISRDEFERAQSRNRSIPMDPSSPRGR